jgi:predicted DNA repair protein MutK
MFVFGYNFVKKLPIIIRVLVVIGTIAMILVAGRIFVHHIPFINGLVQALP